MKANLTFHRAQFFKGANHPPNDEALRDFILERINA
jgi:hypothetical protein